RRRARGAGVAGDQDHGARGRARAPAGGRAVPQYVPGLARLRAADAARIRRGAGGEPAVERAELPPPSHGEAIEGRHAAIPPHALGADHGSIWIKRGDVHAERPEDVVAAPLSRAGHVLEAFKARGIPWVALQEHVPGPIVKFYGVTDGRFFRWYGSDEGLSGVRPAIDENRLKALAFEAAALLGLDVFGGDVAFPEPDRPVLIDLNDWPSFAPFREEAAQAIAA